MHRTKTVLILLVACLSCRAADFSGERALEYTGKAVEFGARTPGSEGHRQAEQWILGELKSFGCVVTDDRFPANTPAGPVEMSNLICRYPGTSGEAVVFSGHYDTKPIPGMPFLGANDAGSSTGLLLEMARVLSGTPRTHDVYIVFFDGEEAYVRYTATDGFYGSRHLARRWDEDGTLDRIRALINVDMIGDRDLHILREAESDDEIVSLIWDVADELGYGEHFLDQASGVLDDHAAFLERGVPAVDLIDFDYGPNNSWWHTSQDTMDKLSADSLQAVGSVLVEVLHRLEQ